MSTDTMRECCGTWDNGNHAEGCPSDRDQFVTYTNLDDIDHAALELSCQQGFGLSVPEGYFRYQKVLALILAPEMAGGVLIIDTHYGPFLSKFWVRRSLQGKGIGELLWTEAEKQFPSFFWRCLTDNPALKYYQGKSDYFMGYNERHIFWRGDTSNGPRRFQMATFAYGLPAFGKGKGREFETISDIIDDDTVERMHGNANFGPGMSPRDVLADGVRKLHRGQHMGYTQQQIILGHKLAYPKRGKAPTKLTQKGHRYREALEREGFKA